MDLVEQNRICYEMPPGSDARQYQNGPPRLIAKYDRKGVEPQLRWRSLELQVRVKAHHPVKPRPPTARRFYFTELAVPLVYIFVSSHVLANVANAAPSQATVEIHHAALSSLPQPLRLRPPGQHC